ncbi:MAG: ArgE/DapE family deacylase [Clostridiales bacterium]
MSIKEVLHQQVIERQQELVQLVSDLLRIPSENPDGEQLTVIRFVEDYLKASGIAYERVAVNPDHPCVLAKMGSEEGFSIILNGHVDVVPAGSRSGWKFDPYCGDVVDGRIRGRGASDMKAGVAGLLFTMRLLQQSGAKLQGNIRLHIVSDEETSGVYGTSWLCANGYAEGGDACLVAEPTSFDNIEIGQKGICHMKLMAKGTPAHGSIGNYVGDNAITKLAKVLIHIDDLTKVPGHFSAGQEKALENSLYIARQALGEKGQNAIDHLTANVGMISGGTKINMVPDYCEAVVDMRLPIGIKKEEIKAAVEELIAKSGVEGVEAELDFKAEANHTDYDAAIVKAVHGHAEKIWNATVRPAYQWASSDAKYYRELGIPTIQFGPANLEGIHSYNEDVDVEDVVHSAEIYMLTFCDLLGIE